DYITAKGQSAGGGAIKITGSDASTSSDQTAQVLVGNSAVIKAKSVSLQSTNLQGLDTDSDSLSIGLASGGGALAHNTTTGDARIDVGTNAQITAVNIIVTAKNAFDKSHYQVGEHANLQSASAAVGSVTALLSETHAGTSNDTMDAVVNIGS